MASALPNSLSNKTITPYTHAMVAHLPEFIHSVVPFTQQGLEKLNDMYTVLLSKHQPPRNGIVGAIAIEESLRNYGR